MQRGNILFLILLAVVLFAALAYAVTSSMRGGGRDAGREKAEAQASDLMNYFAQMSTAVQRMMLTGNVKDYELNFYGPYVYGANDNTNCTENRCRVFHPDGGAVTGRKLTEYTRTNTDNRQRILYLAVPGAGTEKTDIVYQLGTVKTEICNAVNRAIGINGPIFSADFPMGSQTIMYQYAFPVGPIAEYGHTITNLPYHAGSSGTFCLCPQSTLAACLNDTQAPRLIHVLVAR